ncbi:MAG: GvpL/GvpF family gas vesicle protein [Gemmatimonadaceae bacterium]
MAIHLYGLILGRNAPRVRGRIAGIGGAEVTVLAAEPLVALVSAHAASPSRASLDDVRAHDDVLRLVVDMGITVAASRFGQRFPDEAVLRRHLADSADRIAAVLTSFDGAVEMRLLLPAGSDLLPPRAAEQVPEDAGPGRAYLETLRSRVAAPPVSLRAALGPAVLSERVEYLAKSRGVAFAHLVQRENVPGYLEAVGSLPALSDARVVGPLPLYSFAEPTGD